MISIEIDDKPDKKWNDRLFSSNLATIFQINEIAIQFEENNQKAIFLKFINQNGEIVGQLLLSEFSRFQDAPHKIKNPLHKFHFAIDVFGKVVKIKRKVYQWAYGPIIFEPQLSEKIYKSLGDFLLTKKTHKVVGWQHQLSTSGISVLKEKFSLIPWSTFLINLTNSKEEIFRNIEKDSGRKNIRRAVKKGIVIEEINENNLQEYFILRNSSIEQRGGKYDDYEFFLKIWKLLKPIGRSGFLARKDEKAISGLTFSHLCGHIIEGGVARSMEDIENMYYSQDLIRWKIIEWGIENNMKYYNLAGFNPNPQTKKEIGIMRYKKKWGGDKFDYYGISL